MEFSQPVPVAARFFLGPARAEVDFSKPLNLGLIDTGNWSAHVNNFLRRPTVAIVRPPPDPPTRVFLAAFNVGTFDMHANEMTYAPPPFDVVSQEGLQAEAFADFPLSLFP